MGRKAAGEARSMTSRGFGVPCEYLCLKYGVVEVHAVVYVSIGVKSVYSSPNAFVCFGAICVPDVELAVEGTSVLVPSVSRGECDLIPLVEVKSGKTVVYEGYFQGLMPV